MGQKLLLTLLFYGLFGLVALALRSQNVFAFSLYLHGMTMAFVGMFVAASSGEILFNQEEADILLHRPVTPRALLTAKVRVLVEVSLWMAGAFNLIGFFAGVTAIGSGWIFPAVHAVSLILETLFCTASVVLIYQLCLRWFGRERLDGLMTAAQVAVAIFAMLGSQVMPQVIGHLDGRAHLNLTGWWVGLLPPAWFAGLDDALAGSGAMGSWVIAVVGVGATAAVMFLAFGKLASDYGAGLQRLNETVSPVRKPGAARRRWLDVLVKHPPLSWWLRDSVSRAAFLLTAAYLVRDRDVKLRVYPGIAPMLIFPLVFMLRDFKQTSGGLWVAMGGTYLGIVPMLGLSLMRYSQHWQAADLFRAAPLPGPAPLCHGARRAALCLLAFPALIAFGLFAWLLQRAGSNLLLLLPGILALPVYVMVPCLGGDAVPLSKPVEEAKSAGRALTMIGTMIISLIISGIATAAWKYGWFQWFFVGRDGDPGGRLREDACLGECLPVDFAGMTPILRFPIRAEFC